MISPARSAIVDDGGERFSNFRPDPADFYPEKCMAARAFVARPAAIGCVISWASEAVSFSHYAHAVHMREIPTPSWP